jgi:hypothetical protein
VAPVVAIGVEGVLPGGAFPLFLEIQATEEQSASYSAKSISCSLLVHVKTGLHQLGKG